MFSAAAAAGVLSARRRQAERSFQALTREPAADALEPTSLLLVYVHDVGLVPKLANTRLQIRARYGGDGCYKEEYSRKVKSSDEPATAAFEYLFLYQWNRDVEPTLTFDLVKLGFIDWTIASSGLRIPFSEGAPGAIQHDLLFFGKKSRDNFVGQMKLFMEVRSFTRSEIESGPDHMQLSLFDPEWMAAAIHNAPVPGAPVVQGRVVGSPGGLPSASAGIVQGTIHGRELTTSPRSDVREETNFDSSIPAGAGRIREETYRDSAGRVCHVVITRQPDGDEERVEWTD